MSAYVLVSLLGPRREFDLDRLLHRGRYEVAEDRVSTGTEHASWLRKLGFSSEFTGADKWVTIITLSWPLVSVLAASTNSSHGPRIVHGRQRNALLFKESRCWRRWRWP